MINSSDQSLLIKWEIYVKKHLKKFDQNNLMEEFLQDRCFLSFARHTVNQSIKDLFLQLREHGRLFAKMKISEIFKKQSKNMKKQWTKRFILIKRRLNVLTVMS